MKLSKSLRIYGKSKETRCLGMIDHLQRFPLCLPEEHDQHLTFCALLETR
jgi:hypothetical protein